MDKRSLLKDVKVGDSLSFDGGRLLITLEAKSGQRVKLRIVHQGVNVETLPADIKKLPVA